MSTSLGAFLIKSSPTYCNYVVKSPEDTVFIKRGFEFKITGMKRFLVVLAAFILILPLYSGVVLRDGLFSSEEELAVFVREDVTEDEEEFYKDMKIYLLTGGEGSAIWENFGHSAFVIECAGNPPVAFDYGIFTFDETFIPNFILGKLYYEVWETWALYRIADLESADRTVSLLELDLESSEKKALYSFLVYNTEEENRTYLYDYFSDNCATRLRDIYSWATGGEFESWLKSQESVETIRSGVVRHLSRSTFFSSWIINYLLGSSVDRKTTRWEDCYLPSALEKAVEEYQGRESSVLYETQKRKATPDKWPFVFYSFLFGLAFACRVLYETPRLFRFSSRSRLHLFRSHEPSIDLLLLLHHTLRNPRQPQYSYNHTSLSCRGGTAFHEHRKEAEEKGARNVRPRHGRRSYRPRHREDRLLCLSYPEYMGPRSDCISVIHCRGPSHSD